MSKKIVILLAALLFITFLFSQSNNEPPFQEEHPEDEEPTESPPPNQYLTAKEIFDQRILNSQTAIKFTEGDGSNTKCSPFFNDVEQVKGKINIVTIGVGYSKRQDFIQEYYDIFNTKDGFFDKEPYKNRKEDFNLYRYKDVLNDTNSVKTAFQVNQLLNGCTYNVVLILSPSSDVNIGNPYTGIARVYYHDSVSYGKYLVLHELGGHTIAVLGDEYPGSSYVGLSCGINVNITQTENGITGTPDPTCSQWEGIPHDGCFAGCYSDSSPRSSEYSLMGSGWSNVDNDFSNLNDLEYSALQRYIINKRLNMIIQNNKGVTVIG